MMNKTDNMNELSETLRDVFYKNSTKDSNYYIKPFSLMYIYDQKPDGNIVDNIIDYFINIKCNNYNINSIVINNFKDYLYTLGCNVNDYICNNDKYTIMHVISQFVMVHHLNLGQYANEFDKLYGKPEPELQTYGFDIVNRFIFESERPWKSESDYYYEFREFFGQLDKEYKPNNTLTNMNESEFRSLVYELYKGSVLKQEKYTIDSYMTLWRQLYGHKWNNKLITQEINKITNCEVIKDYFIKYYYRLWKKEYNYINEWNDYIRTLSID